MKQDVYVNPKIGRPRDFKEDEALHSAMLLFWEYGYESTSMTLLSKKMKLNAPSIYSTFGDKKSLFLKALDLYVGNIKDIEYFLHESSTAFEATRLLLINSALRFTGKNTPRGCMLASAVTSCSAQASDLQVVAGKIRSKIESFLKLRIQRDIENKILPKSFSAEGFAGLALATIQGMSVLARDGVSRKKMLLIAHTSMIAWNTSNKIRKPAIFKI